MRETIGDIIDSLLDAFVLALGIGFLLVILYFSAYSLLYARPIGGLGVAVFALSTFLLIRALFLGQEESS